MVLLILQVAVTPRSVEQVSSSETALLLLGSVVAAIYLGSLGNSSLLSRLKRRFSTWTR